MAYDTRGFIPLGNDSINQIWQLKTVDALGGVVAAGYISDGITAGSGKGAVGRGARLCDTVRVLVVDNVLTIGLAKTGFYHLFNYVARLHLGIDKARRGVCQRHSLRFRRWYLVLDEQPGSHDLLACNYLSQFGGHSIDYLLRYLV